MALTSKYQQFLARPTPEALAPGAAINYLPSLTTITEPAVIVKHLAAQAQQLKKKENFLNVVYGEHSICVEAETTIDFINGGGTFLPGLDDNFLADHTVTIPVIHIVDFSDTQKIQQIRLLWDQGSLLKSVDVIGSRGKNWPLYDGKDQVRAISTSVDAALSATSDSTSKAEAPRQGRQQSRGGANADKNSSLELFSPTQPERETSNAPSVAPPSTAKPPPRDYHDLFAGGANLGRSESPSKGNHKIGAGKHYHENRLFDSTPVDLTGPGGPGSPEKKGIRTNSKKYDHFDFGEPEKNEQRPPSSKHSKHGPQWNFEDFVTPEKPKERKLPHHERNFGWSDDEEEAKKPIVHRAYVPQARPDAEHHFDFNDESTPTQNRPKSRGQNQQQMGLYEDHITQPSGPMHNHGENGSAPRTSEKMPLSNITNVNTKGHNKTFGSQFDMTDASPTTSGRSENVPEARKKAAGVMQSNWEMYDESPKDKDPKPKGINIQGDGMGARKKPGEKHWWDFESEGA